jgi:hypothetical protein
MYYILINQENAGAADTIHIRTDVLPSQVSIEFWTAKVLGIHKQVHIMKYRRERLDGRAVAINWSK